MKTSLALSTLILASLALSSKASATGTIQIQLVFAGQWTTADGNATVNCSTLATANVTTATSTKTGTLSLVFTYMRPTTDASDVPPSGVTMDYQGNETGHLQYALLGRTPPSGSASGSYNGSVVIQGTSTYPITDTIGPVAQTTSYQGQGNLAKGSNFNGMNINIPWASQADPDTGMTTYTATVEVIRASGNANSSCDVNWKSSNEMSSWIYTLYTPGDITFTTYVPNGS